MALTYKEADEFIAAFLALRDGATDALASSAIQVYPTLDFSGKLIKAGTRINWNGEIKRAATDLWDTKENTPDNAKALWEDIQYKEGYRIIPKVITASLAFSENELGWWNNQLYKSIINHNVYTPEEYAAGWQLIQDK